MSQTDSHTNYIKDSVREFWNAQPCGTENADSETYSKAYFDEIEEFRYSVIPEVFSLAQFTRFQGKKVLEVGVGAGTDFQQWVRAGAEAYGIDLTPEGIEHVRKRLDIYGLTAKDLRVADCENLPFPDNFFDCAYSFGVIHHTPDTPKALREMIRVTKPQGEVRVMIYHRHSILAYFFWVKWALLRGKPWKSLAWCLWNHMESIGTKAYTKNEVRDIIAHEPVEIVNIWSNLTYYDKMERHSSFLRSVASLAAQLLGGDKAGWFLNIHLRKK